MAKLTLAASGLTLVSLTPFINSDSRYTVLFAGLLFLLAIAKIRKP